MRKTLLFLLAVSLLLTPTLAYAQNDLTISELNIQLWPEYDRSDMLVMYSFTLAEDTPLPAELRVRIPADAEINAVAKFSEGSMLTLPYDPPIRDGDSMIITLFIDELTSYRVEYYAPIERKGATRNFSFLWESNYNAELLFVEFQQPPNTTNLVVQPTLPNANPTQEGMVYHTLTKENLLANQPFTLDISYDKSNDDLTVSSMPVEVGGLEENNTSDFSLTESMPALLGGLGFLLIVGGLIYFFLAGRGNNNAPKESRKRHTPRTASAGGNVYCHECGGRARAGDKFCRACGVKLRL